MKKTENFVAHLQRLDAGALANLRHSLAHEPGTFSRAFPYVEPFVTDVWDRVPYYLVAGLYALMHRAGERAELEAEPTSEGLRDGPEGEQDHKKSHSFGWSVSRVRDQDGQRASSTEARFIHLLDAAVDELPQPLRQMVSLLKANNIAVDWTCLLDDLLYWSHPGRKVQTRWARDYYVTPSAQNEETLRRS